MSATRISKAARRLHLFCLFLALGSFVWGLVQLSHIYSHPATFERCITTSRTDLLLLILRYNVGVLASVLVHPGFKDAIKTQDASQRGLITAVYYLGTFTSYIFFAHPAADKLGRRNAAFLGMSVTCVGQALQAGAAGSATEALAMIVLGRIIAGAGTGIISTSVPLYQRWDIVTEIFNIPVDS